MPENNKSSRKTLRTLIWGLLGGALAGLLLAPKTGKGTRNWIAQKSSHYLSESQRLFGRTGARLRYQTGALKGFYHSLREILTPGFEKIELDDDTINQRVKTALGENRRTSNIPRLNIDTIAGMVTVRGAVKNGKQRDAVLRIIKNVRGVIEIVDDLKLAA